MKENQKQKRKADLLVGGGGGISSLTLRYQVFLFPTIRRGKEQAGLFVLKNEPQNGVGVGGGGRS